MKLYATVENEKGKSLGLGSNDRLSVTLSCKNYKQYSVYIEWCDIGDGVMGPIVTVRDWRATEEGSHDVTEGEPHETFRNCSKCESPMTDLIDVWVCDNDSCGNNEEK